MASLVHHQDSDRAVHSSPKNGGFRVGRLEISQFSSSSRKYVEDSFRSTLIKILIIVCGKDEALKNAVCLSVPFDWGIAEMLCF